MVDARKQVSRKAWSKEKSFVILKSKSVENERIAQYFRALNRKSQTFRRRWFRERHSVNVGWRMSAKHPSLLISSVVFSTLTSCLRRTFVSVRWCNLSLAWKEAAFGSASFFDEGVTLFLVYCRAFDSEGMRIGQRSDSKSDAQQWVEGSNPLPSA